jgi:hypothetical protein
VLLLGAVLGLLAALGAAWVWRRTLRDLYAGVRQVSVEQVSDGAQVPQASRVRFRAAIDPYTVVSLVPTPGQYLTGFRDNRAVAVFCGLGCPTENRVLLGSVRQIRGVLREELRLEGTFEGQVCDVDSRGDGVFGLDPEALAEYADLTLERPAESVRIVVVGFGQHIAGALVLSILGFLGVWVLSFMASWAFYRRGLGVEGQARARSQRAVWLVVLFTVLTLGLYLFYWDYATTRDLRRATGRTDLRPWMDLLLSLHTLGLWRLYTHFRNATAVDERRPAEQPIAAQILWLYALVMLCGPFELVVIYRLQRAYNAVAAQS